MNKPSDPVLLPIAAISTGCAASPMHSEPRSAAGTPSTAPDRSTSLSAFAAGSATPALSAPRWRFPPADSFFNCRRSAPSTPGLRRVSLTAATAAGFTWASGVGRVWDGSGVSARRTSLTLASMLPSAQLTDLLSALPSGSHLATDRPAQGASLSQPSSQLQAAHRRGHSGPHPETYPSEAGQLGSPAKGRRTEGSRG